MKKRGILNSKLSSAIAALGHMDTILIGDAGMPIPNGIEIIDLVLCEGVPTFQQVLNAVLDEIVVESYTIASEIKDNKELLELIREKLSTSNEEIINHVDLKKETEQVKFAIRTGEFTPYSNIILRAGVTF